MGKDELKMAFIDVAATDAVDVAAASSNATVRGIATSINTKALESEPITALALLVAPFSNPILDYVLAKKLKLAKA